MSTNQFQFKHFTIHQSDCAMKVGTDGVLLGAWCPVTKGVNALDIGTGTGLIALMLTQRGAASVIGVEIEPDAVKQATDNVKNTHWNNQIQIVNADINCFADESTEHFELIVCNPPFFNNSLKNPDSKRTLARHTDTLSFDQLLHCASKLLTPTGSFCVVLPESEREKFEILAIQHTLYLTRRAIVRTVATSEKKKRVLLSFSKSPAELIDETFAIALPGGEYTDDYKKLTRDFYLFL